MPSSCTWPAIRPAGFFPRLTGVPLASKQVFELGFASGIGTPPETPSKRPEQTWRHILATQGWPEEKRLARNFRLGWTGAGWAVLACGKTSSPYGRLGFAGLGRRQCLAGVWAGCWWRRPMNRHGKHLFKPGKTRSCQLLLIRERTGFAQKVHCRDEPACLRRPPRRTHRQPGPRRKGGGSRVFCWKSRLFAGQNRTGNRGLAGFPGHCPRYASRPPGSSPRKHGLETAVAAVNCDAVGRCHLTAWNWPTLPPPSRESLLATPASVGPPSAGNCRARRPPPAVRGPGTRPA